MFRRATSFLMRASLMLRNHDIPEGFQFMESKVVDKDIHAPFEHLDILRLTLTRQDEFIYQEEKVKCVTITGVNGEYGIYPGHEYKVAQLAPSPITVEYTDGTIQKYFTSGGFAQINNDGSCDINTAECIPVEDLDANEAEQSLSSAQTELSQAKTEKEKSIAEVRIEVLEALIRTLKH